MDEWFLGSRMPKYMAELYYDKKFLNKDFLAEGKDLQFRHRFGVGIMEDNDRNFYGEKLIQMVFQPQEQDIWLN